jgi:hypothetical protein
MAMTNPPSTSRECLEHLIRWCIFGGNIHNQQCFTPPIFHFFRFLHHRLFPPKLRWCKIRCCIFLVVYISHFQHRLIYDEFCQTNGTYIINNKHLKIKHTQIIKFITIISSSSSQSSNIACFNKHTMVHHTHKHRQTT